MRRWKQTDTLFSKEADAALMASMALSILDPINNNHRLIVSVFPRVLEYYEGILFLTTNRVGVFDETFKSRIHLPLYYPLLGT
jgi:hypothetical protein